MLSRLRYQLAGFIMEMTWEVGTDWQRERPVCFAVANWVCPHGIPDNW